MPSAATRRASIRSSALSDGVSASGRGWPSASTRSMVRSSLVTLASTAPSGTRPARTAASSAGPKPRGGAGISRSSPASAAFSVVMIARQSVITIPSNPHSPRSTSSRSRRSCCRRRYADGRAGALAADGLAARPVRPVGHLDSRDADAGDAGRVPGAGARRQRALFRERHRLDDGVDAEPRFRKRHGPEDRGTHGSMPSHRGPRCSAGCECYPERAVAPPADTQPPPPVRDKKCP